MRKRQSMNSSQVQQKPPKSLALRSHPRFVRCGSSPAWDLPPASAALWIGIKGLSQPIGRLKTVMEVLARNDLGAEIPGTERRDELGDMARTVEVFKKNGLEVERLKEEQQAAEKLAAAAKQMKEGIARIKPAKRRQ